MNPITSQLVSIYQTDISNINVVLISIRNSDNTSGKRMNFINKTLHLFAAHNKELHKNLLLDIKMNVLQDS